MPIPWEIAYARAKEVLQERYPELKRKHPALCGCDVGPRIVGGRNTLMPAIRLYVRHKVDERDLSDEEKLPTSLDDVPVDVLENQFGTADERVDAGDSVVPDKFPQKFGTTGLVVGDISTGDPFFLTCAHVIVPMLEQTIDDLHPIGMLDVDADQIGESLKNGEVTAGGFRNWVRDRHVDAALISPTPEIPLSYGIQAPAGMPGPTRFGMLTEQDLFPPAPVWKVGRHGTTHGTVQSIFSPELELTTGEIVVNHILVEGIMGERFAKQGDSGAMLVRGREVVGMIRAVDEKTGRALACHITKVASRMGIDFKRS